MFAGLIVCVAALTLSSFATQVWHLIVLQGVVYGVAGGVLYMPVVGWVRPRRCDVHGAAADVLYSYLSGSSSVVRLQAA